MTRLADHFLAFCLRLLAVPLARRLAAKTSIHPSAGRMLGEKQLLVDHSVIIRGDSRTGIQRVVRALSLQLLQAPPTGYRVRLVYATRQHGYRYVQDASSRTDLFPGHLNNGVPVTVQPGDIFLGLDLTAHLLPRRCAELAQWKSQGLAVHVVVYDLLPLLHPEWFNRKTARNFRRWIRTVAIYADGVVCISDSVKAELQDFVAQKYGLAPSALPIRTIPLGADIDASEPSRGLPHGVESLTARMKAKPSILMVGTVEPRKGHKQVLEAFERLWENGWDGCLVLVGRPGWKTEVLQQRLRIHPANGTRLFWIEQASDQLLMQLYAQAKGVIVASEAEGFGLPLIEAAYYGKPILARDIPVFREVAVNTATFFSGASASHLLVALEPWLEAIENTTPKPTPCLRLTWQTSARHLMRCLGIVDEEAGRNRAALSTLTTSSKHAIQ